MARAPRHWLLKSEPDCFSIYDLANSPEQTTYWDGVRNYQARNFLRDELKLGDWVLFYHSGADPPCIVGTARVVRESYPDHTAWEAGNQHFDPAASPANPIWQMVDIRLAQIFPRILALDELRTVPELAGMELLRRGSRLSVQPVSPAEFTTVIALASRPAPAEREPAPASTTNKKPAPGQKLVARKKPPPAGTARARSKASRVKPARRG